ncbi:MAG: thiamine pyrophosphate-dependent enzyme [Limnochordia bacterium]|jgi:pyruvate ferredoxin oxidoreductase beta subunit
MVAPLKVLSTRSDRLTSGHRACPGCGFPIVLKMVLMSTEDPVVVANATGCAEVCTSIFPYTSWDVPWMHSAFENAAATASGLEAAYRSLKRQGKIDSERDIRFVAFGGDGGTYDIGLQALSGAMERGHNMLYVCYDNGAYMNTGIQRSSATPVGAHTTTSPAGKESTGKREGRKDLAAIMAAHDIPYVAQASIHNHRDLMRKAEKGLHVDGPAFLNVLSPCPLGWGIDPSKGVDYSRLAVESCFWPLFEVENGEWKLSYKPRKKLPVTDFMKNQVRFRHLFRGQDDLLEEIQVGVDERWQKLLKRCGESDE